MSVTTKVKLFSALAALVFSSTVALAKDVTIRVQSVIP